MPAHYQPMKCPTCGGKITHPGLIIDLAANVVIYRERIWNMTPKMAEFLYCLNRAWPRQVGEGELMLALWGGHREMRGRNLSNYACRLRKIFSGTEISIPRGFRGYRLVFDEQKKGVA